MTISIIKIPTTTMNAWCYCCPTLQLTFPLLKFHCCPTISRTFQISAHLSSRLIAHTHRHTLTATHWCASCFVLHILLAAHSTKRSCLARLMAAISKIRASVAIRFCCAQIFYMLKSRSRRLLIFLGNLVNLEHKMKLEFPLWSLIPYFNVMHTI